MNPSRSTLKRFRKENTAGENGIRIGIPSAWMSETLKRKRISEKHLMLKWLKSGRTTGRSEKRNDCNGRKVLHRRRAKGRARLTY